MWSSNECSSQRSHFTINGETIDRSPGDKNGGSQLIEKSFKVLLKRKADYDDLLFVTLFKKLTLICVTSFVYDPLFLVK